MFLITTVLAQYSSISYGKITRSLTGKGSMSKDILGKKDRLSCTWVDLLTSLWIMHSQWLWWCFLKLFSFLKQASQLGCVCLEVYDHDTPRHFNWETKYSAWIEIQSEDMGSDRNGYVDTAPVSSTEVPENTDW